MTGNHILIKENVLTGNEMSALLDGGLTFCKTGIVTPGDLSPKLTLGRRSWEARLSSESHALLFKKINYLYDEACSVFNVTYNKESTTLSVMRYRAQDLGNFDWHRDTIYSPSLATVRKLSLVLLLDDKYDGGALCFESARYENIKAGTCFIFPSDLLHCVEPVVSGVRHSLVSWAYGAAERLEELHEN